jgi:hypothetical protein
LDQRVRKREEGSKDSIKRSFMICSPRQCAGHVARVGGTINTYVVLIGRPEGNRTLGRPRYR